MGGWITGTFLGRHVHGTGASRGNECTPPSASCIARLLAPTFAMEPSWPTGPAGAPSAVVTLDTPEGAGKSK